VAVAGPIQLCRTYQLPGGREDVRRQAVGRALELLQEALESR
jgi:nicotinamide mononucleotide (NMN) deamidase PncC